MTPIQLVISSKEEVVPWNKCHIQGFVDDIEKHIEEMKKEGYKFFYVFKQTGYLYDLTDGPHKEIFKDFNM